MSGPARLVGAVLALLLPVSAGGQTSASCGAALREIFPAVAPGTSPCVVLAAGVATQSEVVRRAADVFLRDADAAVASVFSPRDLQPRQPQQPSLAGTAAQGQAVPSVQPAGVAAGTIAALGTHEGNHALAALGINPAVLFLSEAAQRELARYSRFADITVFLPVSDIAEEEETDPDAGAGDLEYFGARLRLNFHGLAAGDQLWETARSLTNTWMAQAGRNQAQVIDIFRDAPDLTGCAKALMERGDAPPMSVACGEQFSMEVSTEQALQLRDVLAEIRRRVDANYFGVDIRFDHGDPTLGEVEDASGTSIFAGLSHGRSMGIASDGSPVFSIRSNLGVRHSSLDATEDDEFAAEGGIGLHMARTLGDQEINGSAGLELRYGTADGDAVERLQSDYLMVRGSLLIPITSAHSLSVNFGTPLDGDVSPRLSINFNWGVLLADDRMR